MNHQLTQSQHDIQQLLVADNYVDQSNANKTTSTQSPQPGVTVWPGPDISELLYGCKVPDYIVHFFPILPLTFFHIDISPEHISTFVVAHLVVFLAAFFHQAIRAIREFILWKIYTKRGYRCIPVLSDTGGKKYGRYQVALIPMPSIAACIANIKTKKNRALGGITRPSQQLDPNEGLPINAAAEMATGAHKLVQTAETSSVGDAADLVAVSSMTRSVRVPAYCVRTRGGYVGCTCSPYTMNTHGKPLACTSRYFLYAVVAVLEACFAVVVVVGIASFNGWMAVAAVVGGALGHLMTHWQAVTVVEVEESSS